MGMSAAPTSTLYADECRHGLTEAWCSICRAESASKRTHTLSPGSREQSKWYHPSSPAGPKAVATFSSYCPECEDEIDVGDVIYLRKGAWMCEDSAVLIDQLERMRKLRG